MILAFSRKLITVVAVLGLACTLIASACPTCDPAAHAAPSGVGDGCEGGFPGNGWQPEAEGCDCCASDGCDEGYDRPDALLQRPAPVAPVAVALPSSFVVFPDDRPVEARLRGGSAPPRSASVQVLHSSFLC